ncbi:Phosphate transport system regulatory protein PhoU (plasmid) [Cupriavidus sp. U2]|uniref:phosphate signaling complex protein PhoU n=1 Tax=Cupriavidus sp. U2 TaxID=2920269 RepID=UPI00129EE481|nr:phosphate signaling complex protein PhoU [Cupriavidus sp. U2]KAI3590377.1 Phosphate transport system regulatory protein PhoU [Cupriavidus sp. U2]
MSEKHLSSQFDTDLTDICTAVLQMGGLVEAQVQSAVRALETFDVAFADQVIAAETRVNQQEIEIDAHCSHIIARRQPTARDLRLLMAISKSITNLERAGDEAYKIAKRSKRIIDEVGRSTIEFSEIRVSAALAVDMLRNALDAFARLDAVAAAAIVRDDRALDQEFRGFVRKLMSYMMENPRLISVCLDYLFVAKAIERIGDHAKNIAEFTIYIVKGTDVRHIDQDSLEHEANKQ